MIKPETVIEFLWTEGLDEYAEAVKRLQQRVTEAETLLTTAAREYIADPSDVRAIEAICRWYEANQL